MHVGGSQVDHSLRHRRFEVLKPVRVLLGGKLCVVLALDEKTNVVGNVAHPNSAVANAVFSRWLCILWVIGDQIIYILGPRYYQRATKWSIK